MNKDWEELYYKVKGFVIGSNVLFGWKDLCLIKEWLYDNLVGKR